MDFIVELGGVPFFLFFFLIEGIHVWDWRINALHCIVCIYTYRHELLSRMM